jgi:hypothetical protein
MNEHIFLILNRMETKIDTLDGRLDSIDRTQDRLTVSVELHEKRSTTQERRQELCEDSCNRQMDILREMVANMTTTLKHVRATVLLVGGGVGFVAGAAQIFSVWMEFKK